MPTTVKTLICDDHPIVLLALRSELARAGFPLIVTADTLNSAIDALADPELQLVVTDFSFKEAGDGLQWIKRIRRVRPDVTIVVYSMVDSPPMVLDILGAGAKAFVSKDCGARELIAGCQAALRGKTFVAPSTLIEQAGPAATQDPRMALARLSPREREVLRLLAQGLSVMEIGQHFHRSAKTISAQKCSAMSKLGIRQDVDLARYLAAMELEDSQADHAPPSPAGRGLH